MDELTSWHVGVSAEAFAAAQFARYAFYVSVQYGANQPGYDLIVKSGGKTLKISVKGSRDGSWGLTQGYKKGCDYHQAIQAWQEANDKKGIIFCVVQFQGTNDNEMPRMYLATPAEIAQAMNVSAGGRGDTILYENHTWGPRAVGSGTTDKVPDTWEFTRQRAVDMIKNYGK